MTAANYALSRDLRGLNVLIGTIGAEAGVDMTKVAHAVEQLKPLTLSAARALLAWGMKAIDMANAGDSSSGATDRRNKLKNTLEAAGKDLDANPRDPLPDGAAEMLRQKVLQAITEYNSVAEGQATLSAARVKFFSDIVDGAVKLAKDAGEAASTTLSWVKWVAIAVGGVLVVGVAAGVGFGVYSHVRKK